MYDHSNITISTLMTLLVTVAESDAQMEGY